MTTYQKFANWCTRHPANSNINEERKVSIVDVTGNEIAYIYGSIYRSAAGVFWTNFMNDIDRQRIIAISVANLKRGQPRHRRSISSSKLFQEMLSQPFSAIYEGEIVTLKRISYPIDINVDIKRYEHIVDFLDLD